MENNQQDHAKKKKIKLFVLLPVAIVFIAATIFWAVGGGKAEATDNKEVATSKFNTTLPRPNLKNDNWDKLKFYEQAERDSAKRRSLLKNDPIYRRDESLMNVEKDSLRVERNYISEISSTGKGLRPVKKKGESYEDKIYQRIAAINAQTQDDHQTSPHNYAQTKPEQKTAIPNESIDRLEKMMANMQDDEQDSDMQQINQVLDKLGAIQRPELKEWKKQSEDMPRVVYGISLPETDHISLLETSTEKKIQQNINKPHSKGRFYSLDNQESISQRQSTISAMVFGDQVISNKSTVHLKIMQDILVKGILIPAGHEIQGTVAITENRIFFSIRSIVYKNAILPVSLTAYTLEGLEGLPVQGSIAGDVARQSVDRTVQGLNLSTVNTSLAGEALNSSIDAARQLLRRKARAVTLNIPSGYKLLLYDKQDQ